MNWLGKVFVVLILVMSLVFMGLAMAVYATHTNWKELVDGAERLKARLDQARAENEQLKSQHNRQVEQLTAEIEASEQQVRKLETRRVSLTARNTEIQAEHDHSFSNSADATAAVAATQANNERLATDTSHHAQQIRDEQQARDVAFKATLAATEELHQLRNEYETALSVLSSLFARMPE